MRQSKYFLKTSKTQPSDDVSVNARLLEQGGFVQKVMAGAYSYLPLGWRVLSKIERIVREEMDRIGGQEVLMPSLHPKENWLQTSRWQELDVLFKIKSQHGFEYALGPTHEEIVTPMALPIINSYKNLPLAVYQIQTKFRDEPRAKSGLMRTREFRMKDLYSFHASAEDLEKYYNEVAIPAYQEIYKRIGLDALLTEASGGTFSKFSHEYQVEIPNGEDTIYICKNCALAKNKEIFTEDAICTACGKMSWRETQASEVGNIFILKTKFSEPFNLLFTDANGARKHVLMGCYGIGTSRLMGVLVEKFHDDRGIIWPKSIAPFAAHLLLLDPDDAAVRTASDALYEALRNHGVEVLYDDRAASAGSKFADSDLIGIPTRLVVSKKTLAQERVEVKSRNAREFVLLPIDDIPNIIERL